jgi:hypothetical protein
MLRLNFAGAPRLGGGRTVLAATALVVLAGGAAGCTAANGAAGTGSTVPAASTGPASIAASATATGSASIPAPTTGSSSADAGSSAAAVAQCSAADVTVSAGVLQGAAGQSYLTLIFADAGANPCYVDGYPGVELTTADGGKLDAKWGTDTPTRVTLGPGLSASALVSWEHFPQSGSGSVTPADCAGDGASVLLVTVPNQTTSSRLSPPDPASPVCWAFQVGPVVAGTTGR